MYTTGTLSGDASIVDHLQNKGDTNQCPSKVQSCVTLPAGNTEYFPSLVGIKQGDGISPILFNIFLNDIVDAMSQHTKFGYKIDGDVEINSLLYADDLVIFSTSYDEMQNKLNQLGNYCDKWGLEVSIKKSKILYTGNKKLTPFKYKEGSLDFVNSFTYLGIKLCKSGLTQQTKNELVLKAQKAWFKIKQVFYSNNIRSPVLFSK